MHWKERGQRTEGGGSLEDKGEDSRKADSHKWTVRKRWGRVEAGGELEHRPREEEQCASPGEEET